MTTRATRKAPGKLRSFLRVRTTRANKTAPDQKAPDQKAPDQKAPDRKAPDQKAPDQKAPDQKAPSQLRSFPRAMHPRQALVLAVVVGLFVYLMGRPAREVLIAAAAVLVAQLVMGLANDLADVEADRRSGASGKPVAEGLIPPGNVSYVIAMLLLIAIPLSLQNGTLAGLFLLGTLVVGFVHNRWLHRTLFSWVGWSATFALLTYFITFGGWGNEADGSAPLPSFVILGALLGFLVHFLTSLPDLVEDNKSGTRHLPLRVALKTGAPKLMVVTLVATVAVVAVLIYKALTVGIAY